MLKLAAAAAAAFENAWPFHTATLNPPAARRLSVSAALCKHRHIYHLTSFILALHRILTLCALLQYTPHMTDIRQEMREDMRQHMR